MRIFIIHAATRQYTETGQDEIMFLSIVIPAYNEAKRLPKSLRQVTDYLARQSYQAEAIVVDDGSTDATAQVVAEFAAAHPTVRLIKNSHRGKGYTVKTGMLAGQGEYIFFCDADFSMPVEEIAKFLPPALDNYDVAIGSREISGAKRYGEPPYRHLMGRVFNTVVRLLAVPGIEDTQCGFKCFRREVVKDIFERQTMDGWGFDVELLFIARKHGYCIKEVPVNWYYMANSRVSPIRDSIRMFREVWQVRLNNWRGMYD